MSIAAVPSYLGQDFKQASTGLRFGMYLKLWGVNERTHRALWGTHDVVYRVRGRNREERELREENKVSAINAACALSQSEKQAMEAILARQESLAVDLPDCFTLPAQSTAPFTAGMGNEHPLENGFSFLSPYGLPYLPGSGVKGVLRQAARELISGEWGNDTPWRQLPSPAGRGAGGEGLLALDILFGLETEDRQTEQFRGVLSFWDVIPDIKSDKLMVEIMTPHQTHYYRDGQQPHDSGQPTPISFLTVPPGSGFTFHVQCDLTRLTRLAPELARDDHWKTLLESAFGHAFEWLGFGAKTAVGYGAMKKDEQQAEAARKKAEEEVRRARLSPLERQLEEICRREKNNNPGTILFNKLEAGDWESETDQRTVALTIKALWQAENKWNPGFSGKNKGKVRQKERCLKLLAYLARS